MPKLSSTLPPLKTIPQTLTINFKDGTILRMPYFEPIGVGYYLEGIRKDMKSFSIEEYTGE